VWQKSLSTGVTTRDDLDKFVNLELGYPKGIFGYADGYGIDNIVNLLKLFRQKYRKFRFESDQFLIEIVEKRLPGV